MRNIVLIGSSGHAKVITDIVEKQGQYKIAGFLGEHRFIGEELWGYKVLGNEEDLPVLTKKHNLSGGIIAIGDNYFRSVLVRKIEKVMPGFRFVTAIHPKAVIGNDVCIENGTVVMAGTIINSSVSIGCHCILNTSSALDHDSKMEAFSSLAPKATIGGNVKIGRFSAVSIGAVVIDGLSIGKHTVIGAGATVLSNIDDFKIAYGTPAKEMRDREAGEKYL